MVSDVGCGVADWTPRYVTGLSGEASLFMLLLYRSFIPYLVCFSTKYLLLSILLSWSNNLLFLNAGTFCSFLE